MHGLLLTGGGARGAYQAGVLRAISEILGDGPRSCPFPVLTGMSAGAINTMLLASHPDDFAAATKNMERIWTGLTMERIFETDFFRVGKTSMRWMRNLAFGGQLGYDSFSGLLNPKPMRQMLEEEIDFTAFRAGLAAGHLRGLALLCTHYASGSAVAFVEAAAGVEPWSRGRRLGRLAQFEIKHIMASSAIPVIFPPVEIEGGYYGDGSVRMSAPFSPAIHLGADKILAVSVRKIQPSEYYENAVANPTLRPSIGAIAGSLLNAVFMDSLDGDIERLKRVNQTLVHVAVERRASLLHSMRPIETLAISPGADLGELARPHLTKFPSQIRFLLKGIGADQPGSSDFLSYIMFDRDYCRELFDLGRQDAHLRADELKAFFQE